MANIDPQNMARSKAPAVRSSGISETRERLIAMSRATMDAPTTSSDGQAQVALLRASRECYCATDCTGVCSECTPWDHYTAWRAMYGPDQPYPYATPPISFTEAISGPDMGPNYTNCLGCGKCTFSETAQLCCGVDCLSMGDSDATEVEDQESDVPDTDDGIISDDEPGPSAVHAREEPKNEPTTRSHREVFNLDSTGLNGRHWNNSTNTQGLNGSYWCG